MQPVPASWNSILAGPAAFETVSAIGKRFDCLHVKGRALQLLFLYLECCKYLEIVEDSCLFTF
jgi:hypothetical protein